MNRPAFQISNDGKYKDFEKLFEQKLCQIDNDENLVSCQLCDPQASRIRNHPYYADAILYLVIALAKQYEYFKNDKDKEQKFFNFLKDAKFIDAFGRYAYIANYIKRPFIKSETNNYLKNAEKLAGYSDFINALYKSKLISKLIRDRIINSNKDTSEKKIFEFMKNVDGIITNMNLSEDPLKIQLILKNFIKTLESDEQITFIKKHIKRFDIKSVIFIGLFIPILDKKIADQYIKAIEKKINTTEKKPIETIRYLFNSRHSFYYNMLSMYYGSQIIKIKNSFEDIYPSIIGKNRFLIGLLAPFYIVVGDKYDKFALKYKDKALIKLTLSLIMFPEGNPFEYKHGCVELTEYEPSDEVKRYSTCFQTPYFQKLLWEGLFT